VESLTVKEIIDAKERTGIKVQYIIRILIALVYLVFTYTMGTGKEVENTLVTWFVVVFIFIGTVLYLILRNHKFRSLLHYVGVLLDVFFLSTIAIILHQVMGTDDIPFSFILKSDIYPMSVLLLIFHMINFNPRVTLFSGFLLLLFNITILVLAAITAPALTSDFNVGFTSYNVNIEFEMGKIVTFFLISFIGYSISKRARKTVNEGAAAEVSRNQLGRYFSPGISQSILNSFGKEINVGGRIQDVTILFSDIQNFTTISENLNPNQVLSFLAEYHEAMVSIIFKFKGTLDKFIGDSIMATFGTPIPHPDDTFNAISAALEMEKALFFLNEKRINEGKFPIYHRIGIHCGPVLAGNIGTNERMEYTVLGDAVNTASRVEAACKDLSQSLLVSEEVFKKTQTRFTFETAGEITLKGKSKKSTLYSVIPKSRSV
jgi:adenylate cyclase